MNIKTTLAAVAVLILTGLSAALTGVKGWRQDILPPWSDAGPNTDAAYNDLARPDITGEDAACAAEDAGCYEDAAIPCEEDAAIAMSCGTDVGPILDATRWDQQGHDILGPLAPVKVAWTDGYSSIACYNLSGTPIHIGGADLAADDDGPGFCSDTTVCPSTMFSLPTYQGQLYAITASRVGAGIPLRCVAGH